MRGPKHTDADDDREHGNRNHCEHSVRTELGQQVGHPVADADRTDPAPGEGKADRAGTDARREQLRRIGVEDHNQPVVAEARSARH